jgi:dihydroorotase
MTNISSTPLDLVIEGATIVAPDPKTGQLKTQETDIGLRNGLIEGIGSSSSWATTKKISAKGLHLLPGAIDTQVHFRDPGFPEKETLMSGSRAAVFGGVTAFFDMPNTKPPTVSALDVADKMSRAEGRTWCHYGFYVGATSDNADRLKDLENLPGVCGVKMFMGSSTGNLLVGRDEAIARALKSGSRIVAIHSEDEDRLQARKSIVTEKPGHVELHPVWRDEESALISTKKIVRMAREAGRKIHVLHVTTAEEVEFLKDQKDIATFEVTPQHLTLAAPECYERLGTLAQMNPPIRVKRHQEALWKAVLSGSADVLGSDHAPHTRAEKNKTYPESPSGMTGVQTMLPLMIHHHLEGRLPLLRVVELLCQNPARIFSITNKGQIQVGADADLVLVDLKTEKLVRDSWLQSACGWSPFTGMNLKGAVIATLVRGEVVMRDDELIGKPRGRALEFN